VHTIEQIVKEKNVINQRHRAYLHITTQDSSGSTYAVKNFWSASTTARVISYTNLQKRG